MYFISLKWWHNNSRLGWATFYALLDFDGANIRRIFETCKHFRYFLREFKKRPAHAIAAGAGR
jgi:hypothetical protein